MLIPRLVAFDKDDKAICAGLGAYFYEKDAKTKVMFLPSEHYDFIDMDVHGKTESEILNEIANM